MKFLKFLCHLCLLRSGSNQGKPIQYGTAQCRSGSQQSGVSLVRIRIKMVEKRPEQRGCWPSLPGQTEAAPRGRWRARLRWSGGRDSPAASPPTAAGRAHCHSVPAIDQATYSRNEFHGRILNAATVL